VPPAQRSLFEIAPATDPGDWRPQSPPDLSGVSEVYLDLETTGLRWWGGDLPVGVAVATADGRSWYLPTGHAGGNLDESSIKRWMRQELRDKTVIGFNLPFDVNMAYAWGIDLEAQGCRLMDVGNHAALIDDTRTRTSLDAVSKHYLGYGKLDVGLNKSRMRDYHAADVAEYARRDTLLCVELLAKFRPVMQQEGLEAVRELEDELVYVTCDMMRNGAPLNEEKLDLWLTRSEQDYVATLWEIHRLTGLNINVRSRPDMIRLFEHLQLPPPISDDPEEVGKISFSRARMREVDHPVVNLVNRARSLASLRSKFLVRYREELRRNGILRYSLHQMPIDDEGGTRSGRYSSSSFGTDPDEGVNIQQVAGKKQLQSVGNDTELQGYIVRELFVPGEGLWLSADAEQIEYRLFADYAKPPKVLAAYARDPRTDFHNIVMNEMIKPIFPSVTREKTKDTNFAKIYGAQLKKIARMLGLRESEAKRFIAVYDRAFPEAERLLRYTSSLAESRGYVKTKLGRRRRFPPGMPTYAALNGVVQGSAADEMKTKALMLHRARKKTGFKLRFLVHDEVNGDVPDREAARMVEEILNTQVLKTVVPLLWAVGVGENWQEAKAA